jgi:hypothetical protein
MYAKVFEQIFDSSLRDKWQAWVVFVALLVLADENDEVDMTVEALKARTGLPGTIVPEGLAFLEAPDEFSRSPEYEGRRIVRLDDHRPWGWKIVNRDKYKRIRDQSERRDYFREQKRTKRREQYEAKHGCPPPSTSVNQRPPQAVGSRQLNQAVGKESEPTPLSPDGDVSVFSQRAKKQRTEAREWVEAFEEHFWRDYLPLRQGAPNPKAKALKAWLSVRDKSQASLDAIYGEFRACMRSWKAEGTEPRHIPHASSWLNARIREGVFYPSEQEVAS